ncbi:MAG: hypothetical protein HY866_11725 [Chloroflexi bacterium]|nr:hypothetical protein [Chloroflexota bacterium]
MIDIFFLLLGIVAFTYCFSALLRPYETWKAAAKLNAWLGFQFDEPKDWDTYLFAAFGGLIFGLITIVVALTSLF